MMIRRLFIFGFAAALPMAIGCSSGGTADPSGPMLACSDAGAPPTNGVGLTCGGATTATTELVRVTIVGPATGSTTLQGVNFDLTYDATKLQFVPAASYTSPLFPGALVGVTLFDGQPGRVVVSIQNTGGVAVAVPAGQTLVLGLSFSAVAGATFAPTPVAFENAEATVASTAVTFGGALALSYQ